MAASESAEMIVGVLIGLVGLVFASAVLAVIAGGVATWGGLREASPATGGVISHVPKWQEPLLNVVLWVELTSEADSPQLTDDELDADA